jgi:hypothetical protein
MGFVGIYCGGFGCWNCCFVAEDKEVILNLSHFLSDNNAFFCFYVNHLLKVAPLAQIEMESLAKLKAIFCWCKTATNGSSFCAKQKKLLTSKLGMESWIGF